MTACLPVSAIFCLHNAQAATTTAIVEANIVSTINLVAQNGIVFGDISSSSIPGTVTIGTDSSRVTTGGVTVNSNTSGTPATYEVSGDPNAFYHVTLPDSVVLTSAAGDSMVVNNFSSIPDAQGQLDAGGKQNMNIGATLNVGSFQPFGAYRGIMSTTVDYD
jgi:lipopolysaccharide export system protein LptA